MSAAAAPAAPAVLNVLVKLKGGAMGGIKCVQGDLVANVRPGLPTIGMNPQSNLYLVTETQQDKFADDPREEGRFLLTANLKPIKDKEPVVANMCLLAVPPPPQEAPGKSASAPAAAGAGGGAAAPLVAAVPVAETFHNDVERLQDILRIELSDDQREAYKHRYFNETRASIREGRFDRSKGSVANLRAVLNGFVHTATRRRLSTLARGLYLDGLIKGCETRGRPSDIFYAIRVEDGAVGAAKIFYAALGHEEPNPASAAAEWSFSQRLDAAAAAAAADRGGDGHRHNVARYSDIVDLGNGRTALFMLAYTRSLHQLVEESHVSVPLPARFLLRTAQDVLRGLCLLHAAGLSHCDVKPDNIMYAGDGTASLIDLGAVTELGQPVVEGMPPVMALGIDLSRGSVRADLVGLASTLWWALRRTMPPSGSTPLTLAQRAEELAAGHEPLASKVLQAIAAILRAESADAALSALEAIVAA